VLANWWRIFACSFDGWSFIIVRFISKYGLVLGFKRTAFLFEGQLVVYCIPTVNGEACKREK